MLKLLQFFIFSTIIYAQNPTVYSSLGDTIYANVENIQSLKSLKEYALYKEKIDAYSLKVVKTKELGFKIESGLKSDLHLDYLNQLRELSKVNNYFIRSINTNFIQSITTTNNDLFVSMVNSKLLDTQKNKNKIMSYYEQHKDSIKADGIIQKYLDEDKAQKKRNKKYTKNKKQIQKERIQRIRENDALRQKALEDKLEKELEEKKKVIREAQEKELFN